MEIKMFNNMNKNSDDGSQYFKQAGDIGFDNLDKKEIKDYLLTIVSGVKYDFECELGILKSGGRSFVSLPRLKEMVDSGFYNIISARYFDELGKIEVEFQEYERVDRKGMGR